MTTSTQGGSKLTAPLLGETAPSLGSAAEAVVAVNGAADSGSGPTVNKIASHFAVLGWTAFGGPTAHIARFHNSFVERMGWLSDSLFAEMLALCQMLPGPTSTQLSFFLGVIFSGPAGGLLSGGAFLFPGLILMTLFGLGATHVLAAAPPWVSSAIAGLVAVAVALVAEASFNLSTRLCKDKLTRVICCTCAAIAFCYPAQWLFPVLIVAGGAVVFLNSAFQSAGGFSAAISSTDLSNQDSIPHLSLTPLTGILILAAWGTILVGAIVGRNLVEYSVAPWIHWFSAFFVAGSAAYGGGQVMLPFLQQTVVKYDTVCPPDSTLPCYKVESNSTWVTEQEFLTGLGIVQAMPGPLFNFSAYLGACMGGLWGAFVCWFGLFGPGIFALYASLPFWNRFRTWALYRKALPGFNSAAVGLIYAAVFQLGLSTYKSSPFPTASVTMGILGFGASSSLGLPAPLVILLGALFGFAYWAMTSL